VPGEERDAILEALHAFEMGGERGDAVAAQVDLHHRVRVLEVRILGGLGLRKLCSREPADQEQTDQDACSRMVTNSSATVG
jgi:hypothetical protein